MYKKKEKKREKKRENKKRVKKKDVRLEQVTRQEGLGLVYVRLNDFSWSPFKNAPFVV